MAWGELAGTRVIHGTIVVPYYGIWCGDVELAVTTSIPSPTTLVLGNLSMKCTVFRQLNFGGTLTVRLVGGYGGWQKTVAARSYSNPAGVPLSMILTDVAADCGEKMGAQALSSAAAAQSVGSAYVRESAPAARVLKQLLGPPGGQQWWVDTGGNTQIADRQSLPITGNPADAPAMLGDVSSPYTVVRYRGGKGAFLIAHEDPAAWMPGRSFKSEIVGPRQILSMVTHEFKRDGTLRTEALTTVGE